MINIVVNCNSDEVIIAEGEIGEIRIKVSRPSEMIEVLENVLNKIMFSGETIYLGKIDEEFRYTIGEW